MRNERAAPLANQPALVVTYGNTTRKHRPLERDVTVLGRAPGCDVGLVSPEVAPVHCIIARVAGGWRLRDCTGRGGTRLNGQGITEASLSDGDVLQVGTFSFRLRLPGAKVPPGVGTTPPPQGADLPDLRHLEQSRRNLAQLALRLRRRLRVAESAVSSQEELDLQADRLRTLHREIETRRRQQEQAEAGLRAEREAFEQELAGRRRQVEETEVRLRAERLQMEERARSLEEAERRVEEAQRQVDLAPNVAREELDRKAAELSALSRNLNRRHLLVQEQARELAREQDAFRREREEAAREDQRESDRLRLQIQVLEAEAADLKARFAEQAATAGPDGDAQALLAALRQQVRERDVRLAEMEERLARPCAGPDSEDHGDEAAEVDRLRHQVEELEAEAADLRARFEEQEAELTTLRSLEDAQAAMVELSGGANVQALLASLRQQVRERDALLAEMEERLARHSAGPALEDDGYEAELNRYRQELEKDRRELNEQFTQLQVRHAEMEEAAREAELQMARERAQIAREQAELNRLRNELSLAQNRSPRERGLQERLAAVRRLQQETRDKGGAEPPAQEGAPERPRWRRLFGRTSDAPASQDPA